MHISRSLLVLVIGLVAAVGPTGMSLAADPTASGPQASDPGGSSPLAADPGGPSPLASALPIPSIDWQPVDGLLGGAVADVSLWVGQPIHWRDGLAVLERGGTVLPGTPDAIDWQAQAVWVSGDGVTWDRRRLPDVRLSDPTLLGWRGGLVLASSVVSGRGWRIDLWSSPDGVGWSRLGHLQARPTGRLRGCAFTEGRIAATEDRILAVASCVPYENGTIGGSAVAGVDGSAQRATDAANLWAWTSVDGRRWSRHLVTEGLDPAGAAQHAVVLRSIGSGFAAVMCCYPPRLWWSDDGAHWREVSTLPDTVAYQDVHDLGAVLRDGSPTTWLLVGDREHPVSRTLTGALGTLWTGSAGGWTEVHGAQDWVDGDVAADGDTAVLVATKVVSRDPEDSDVEVHRLDTMVSLDGGRTWSLSEGPETGPCSVGGVALMEGRAVLTCPDVDGVSVRIGTIITPAAR
jgi:hypothetical protein